MLVQKTCGSKLSRFTLNFVDLGILYGPYTYMLLKPQGILSIWEKGPRF